MKFEYKPYFLAEWVKEEIKVQVNYYESEEFLTSLEDLRGLIHFYNNRSEDEYNEWFNRLLTKTLILFPFVFQEIKSKTNRKLSQEKVVHLAKSNRQLFRNAIEACYQNNVFDVNWKIAKIAYTNNFQKVTRGWSNRKVELWDNFFLQSSEFEKHVAELILRKGVSVGDAQHQLHFNDGHAFYNSLLLLLFTEGSTELYRQEKKKFIEMFNRADTSKQQLLARGFIRSRSLEAIEEISFAIYEKMKTYIRQPMKWDLIEEAVKKEFNKWVMSKNVREFFMGINKDHERFIYWEKFIPTLQDVVIIEGNTMLMFFEDVVIMEILGTGAVYVYRQEFYKIRFNHLVQRYIEEEERVKMRMSYYNRYRLSRSMLMEKDSVVPGGWLTHVSSWQNKFDNFLKNRLKWEVEESEILRKNENIFTV
ncbi:hypothetical protein [Paenisporosarcina sp.]|uniref:hypothetical protein n=1 Tax=Paenisporosarcina sp. TaxID=1932001 RepID=UPI003C73FD72